jgi:FtsZ-interacting cell division protein YlmF
MASLWQKTLFYLGLVDEDAAGGPVADQAVRHEDPRNEPAARRVIDPGRDAIPGEGSGVVGRRVEPPLTARRRTSPDSALAEAGVIVRDAGTPSVRTLSSEDLETEVIEARTYSDAQMLADHIRANIPVVLDLRKIEPAMVRRLVDFASGLTYALGGSMRKTAQGVILVLPANVNVTRDERRRLAGLGYYEAPES